MSNRRTHNSLRNLERGHKRTTVRLFEPTPEDAELVARIRAEYSTTMWVWQGRKYFYQRAPRNSYFVNREAGTTPRWFLFDAEREYVSDFPTLKQLRWYVETGKAA